MANINPLERNIAFFNNLGLGGPVIPNDLDEQQQEAATNIVDAITASQTNSKPKNTSQVQALAGEFQEGLGSLQALANSIKKKYAGRRSPPLGDGEVQIGVVRLSIPPEKIIVQEMPNLIEVPGLRTDGNTVIKTGKGRINIILDLVFNGEAAINNELRTLVAQFRGYPYVPLVSKYISGIVQPKLQQAIPPDAKQRLDKAIDQANRTVYQHKELTSVRLVALLRRHPGLQTAAEGSKAWTDALTAFSKINLTLAEVDKVTQDIVTELARLASSLTKEAKAFNARQDVTKLQLQVLEATQKLKLAIVDLERIRHTRAMIEVGGLIDLDEGIVPATLDQLQIFSVADRPHMLRARLVLSFFNSGPFGGVLQYRDILGRPTIDPAKAIYYQEQLGRTWLQEPNFLFFAEVDSAIVGRTVPILGLSSVSDSNPIHDDLHIKYYDVELESDAIDTQRPDVDIALRETATDSTKNINYLGRVLQVGSQNRGVIRGISTTLSNRLSFQQVQGQFYPTAQYMGGKPAYAEVELMITDENLLKEIHGMKVANQRMSTLALRQTRKPEVLLKNSLLNLVGMFTAQLDNIVTETISPNTTRVVLRFVEHRIDIAQREELVKPTLFSKGRIKNALRFLTDIAAQAVDGFSPRDLVSEGYMNPTDPRFGSPWEGPSPQAKAAHALLYPKVAAMTFFRLASSPKDLTFKDTIFEPEMIANALFLEENKKTADIQHSVRLSVLQASRILPSDQNITDDQINAKIKAFGGPVATAKELIRRWGWGAPRAAVNPNAPVLSLKPTDLELDLISHHLFLSSGNAADELEQVDGKEGVRIVRKDGEDKTADLQPFFRLAYAIINNTVAEPNGRSLREIGMGDTNVRDFLRNQRSIPSMLYPDLQLPSYKRMLSPLLAAIEEHFSKPADKGKPSTVGPAPKFNEIQDINKELLLNENVKTILNTFIPTFRQLGQIPDRLDLNLDSFAYDLDDDALPDFPYFGVSTQALVNRALSDARKDASSLPESFRAKRDQDGKVLDERGKPREINDAMAQARRKNFDENPAEANAKKKEEPKKIVPLGSGTNTEILTTELYSPGFDRTTLQDLKINDTSTYKAIFEAASLSHDDSLLTMRRCFPTFRLFFIEEDTKEGVWRAIDDVYGYNSVISLTVTRHKYQPDLAEVQVTNLEGNLESDRFGISTARGGGGDPKFSKDQSRQGSAHTEADSTTSPAGPTEPGTNEAPQRRFPLSEGTRVMIQMGYHSNPRFLETVFTGKIAEVTMGDIVHFVAQGYLQELLFPMVNNPNTEKIRGVVETVMNSPTVQHFGTWTPYSWRYMTPQESNNSTQHNVLSSLGINFEKFYADPKLRNVWVAQYGTWWGEFLSRFSYQDKWEVGGGTKTGWDVIQEIISYSPGFVAAVVPYDTEATLFVGRPEQPYFWTDSRQDMHNQWSKAAAEKRTKTNDFTDKIGKEYFVSSFYDGRISDLGRVTSEGKLARWLELAQQYPWWAVLLETQARLGRVHHSGGVFETVNHIDVTDSFATKGGALREEFIRELQPLLETITNTTGVSAASDFAEVARMLGSTPQAREFILRLLGQILQRGQSALAPGTTEHEGFTKEIGLAAQLLPRLHSPESLFSVLWSPHTKGTFADRALTAVSIADLKPLTGLDAPIKDPGKIIAQILTKFRASIPVALRSIRDFVVENVLELNLNLADLDSQNQPSTYSMSPRMRPFRSYHMVSSIDDILDNQMSASRGAMWNAVSIGGASGPPLIIKADDGIIKGDLQLRHFREPNADNDFSNTTQEDGIGGFVNNRFLVGFTRLAEGLRFTYRGHLVLRGRPSIKPSDIIFVYDTYNMIFGPIEVERVTHHFSAETGFVTTIVPHMVVIANNQIDCSAILAQGWYYGRNMLLTIGLGGLVIGGLAGLALGAPLGLAVGLGLAFGGKSLAEFVSEELAQTSLFGMLIGNGQFGGKPSPVKIFPLMRHGAPWVASIRGWGNRDERSLSGMVVEGWDRLGKKTDDALFYWKKVWKSFQEATSVPTDTIEMKFLQENNAR